MARARKDSKRIYLKMASDAAELLNRYCKLNHFDATFAIEHLIRLHVPIMLKRQRRSSRADQDASEESSSQISPPSL